MIATPLTPGSWEALSYCGPFSEHIGPLQMLLMPTNVSEPLRIGMIVAQHHCNPAGHCHGGMLATLVDIALGRIAAMSSGVNGATVTISMSVDYMRPASMGSWLESRAGILHRTRRTVFVAGELIDRDGCCVRGSGVFRLLTRLSPKGDGQTP